jgi:hypothetical protein
MDKEKGCSTSVVEFNTNSWELLSVLVQRGLMWPATAVTPAACMVLMVVMEITHVRCGDQVTGPHMVKRKSWAQPVNLSVCLTARMPLSQAAYPGLVVTGGVGARKSSLIYYDGNGVSSITDTVSRPTAPVVTPGKRERGPQAVWAGLVISSISPSEPDLEPPLTTNAGADAIVGSAAEGHTPEDMDISEPHAPLGSRPELRNADMIDILRGALPVRQLRGDGARAVPKLARHDMPGAGVTRSVRMPGAEGTPTGAQASVLGDLRAMLEQAPGTPEAGTVPDMASDLSVPAGQLRSGPSGALAEVMEDFVVPDVNPALMEEGPGPSLQLGGSAAGWGSEQAHISWTESSWSAEATQTGESQPCSPV